MATVVVTLRVMPENPDIDLEQLSKKIIEKIKKFAGKVETKVEIEPIGFGLSALKVFFAMNEAKGDTEPLEREIGKLEGVNSVEAVDVRRAIG